jgi:ATP-binding protein involved in chromosome partitioning
VTFRTYHDLTAPDRSGLAEQVAAQHRRVRERLAGVRRVVAVVSGKGGVGKSFVTAMLARGSAAAALDVGVLDADLKSPTVARMLGAEGPLVVDGEGVHPARARDGIVVISTDLLLAEGAPLRWRGEASAGALAASRGLYEAGAVRELLGDVVWGALDLLLIDLPPDGDRVEDLAALVPGLAGAVVVTIPSEESRRSVERTMRGAADAGVRILGVVENMSGYHCARCGSDGALFEGAAGARLAASFGVPLLGRVPWLPGGARQAPLAPVAELTRAVLEAVA